MFFWTQTNWIPPESFRQRTHSKPKAMRNRESFFLRMSHFSIIFSLFFFLLLAGYEMRQFSCTLMQPKTQENIIFFFYLFLTEFLANFRLESVWSRREETREFCSCLNSFMAFVLNAERRKNAIRQIFITFFRSRQFFCPFEDGENSHPRRLNFLAIVEKFRQMLVMCFSNVSLPNPVGS